jgi:hypothetical protein
VSIDEWLDSLALWARLWPQRPLPHESAEAWFLLLEDLDAHDVRAGLLAMAADPENRWPPASPGEIRDRCAGPDEDWVAALARLADLVRRHPYYDPPTDLEPALAEYVRSLGGWSSLCRSLDLTDSTTRAQFRDHWRVASRRAQVDRAALVAGSVLPELTAGDDDR